MTSGSLRLLVNGELHERPCQPGRSLLETLREELGLTGAKYGCGEGECGACTVLVDGRPVRACVVPVSAIEGRAVVTVEGLARGREYHPVQRAFAGLDAVQCGYCTPGMVISAVALLTRKQRPSDAEIVEAMNGNLCRCCAYPTIVAAVRRAAQQLSASSPVPMPAAAVPMSSPSAAPWDMRTPGERDYFDVLGDGLVVALPADPEEAAWRPGSVGGGSWLHVRDGGATVFTGKVDVGQGTRAALALLVAEELALPPDRVRVVMGDTDLCPFDIGTFGSRSMPVAARAARIAAATARRLLCRLAAERWQLDFSAISLADGCAIAEGRSVSFGQLLRGRRLMEPASRADATPIPPAGWRTAGRPAPDPAVWEAVTGARRFATDITRPGMLHARIVRPPVVGATLASLDLSAAEAVPGAIVVHAHGVVGVAAADRRVATHAAGQVRAEWNVPHQPSEEELAAHLRGHPVEAEGWDGAFDHATGGADRALADAASSLRDTYTTAYLAHAPLETRSAVADWKDGRLTVWVGTQQPFGVRSALAQALGVDEAQVRVVVPDTGGGFGGKHSPETALCAAQLARTSGRPVKVRWTREEEFRWAYFRPAAVIDVASGVDARGRLSAWTFLNTNAGAAAILCPYDVPNQRIRFQPSASPLPQGPYRSLAAVANTFARERHIDRVARALGRDPVDFRLEHLSDSRLRAVLEAVVARSGWPGETAADWALGVAIGVEKGGYVATCAEITLADGAGFEIKRIVTAFECGAIVHPEKLRGQVEGATIMGIGGALFEAVHFDRGTILNASFASYRVPRFSDVPPIEIILIDRPDIDPAGGGETPITAVAPAIANAIAAASGHELTALPLLPALTRQSATATSSMSK